jgi:hypothetical protein
MGQGRRWLAGGLVLLFAAASMAGELPNAPSSLRALPNESLAELRSTAPPALDLTEAVPQPIVIEPGPQEKKAGKKKVFDKKLAVLSGLAAGLTIVDFEMTQRCLHRRTCVEADPLMPTSHAGMYLTNMPLNAALFWWSYRRKEDGKRLWWLAPLMVIGSHAAGVATNVRFVGK